MGSEKASGNSQQLQQGELCTDTSDSLVSRRLGEGQKQAAGLQDLQRLPPNHSTL